MGRYKKAILNEIELPEIGGVRPLIKPTIEHRFDVIAFIADLRSKGEGEQVLLKGLPTMTQLLTDVLWYSLHETDENGKIIKLKDTEKDTTRRDVETYVANNIAELWVEYGKALGLFSEEDLKKQQEKIKVDLGDHLKN